MARDHCRLAKTRTGSTTGTATPKRVMAEQAENASEFFVKAGWIVMACSGQTYGLIGNVALMTKREEKAFFSHDFVRMIPKPRDIRAGYLFAALGHPRLGRPMVIRFSSLLFSLLPNPQRTVRTLPGRH